LETQPRERAHIHLLFTMLSSMAQAGKSDDPTYIEATKLLASLCAALGAQEYASVLIRLAFCDPHNPYEMLAVCNAYQRTQDLDH
jgi:hypothetical protein